MSEPGGGVFRSVQTFFEFIVAGTLILMSLYGLLTVVDHHAATDVAHATDRAAKAVGIGSVLLIAAVYGVGVLIDDLTRLTLEERPLNRIKVARLTAFEQRNPGFIARVAGLDDGAGAAALTELQKFGVMRMYVLLHGEQLYSEVTNQVGRLRLGRVLFASLVVLLCALTILATRTSSPLAIGGAVTVACVVAGAFKAMMVRFDRYVRAVERTFFVLGASSPPAGVADDA